MHKFPFFLLIFLCAFASDVFAGEIFGTVRDGVKPVSKGIKIEIASPKKVYTTQTDAYGSYRVYVGEKGKCTLKIYYKDQAPSFEVYSYDKSTRYDLSLENKDGKYFIKRK